MILTSAKIEEFAIVHNGTDDARKPTTYNATVGRIILAGEEQRGEEYQLPPRGMVWVVSREEFEMPETVTGLATLKTTWTHDGILALNVGIVDPSWYGPLATALVNFSEKPFPICKGQQFLRVLFLKHAQTSSELRRKPMEEYASFIKDKSSRTANTFLNVKALSAEVIDEVFTIPRWVATLTKWGVAAAVVAVLAALLAIFVPIAWGVGKDWATGQAKLEQLQREVDTLKRGRPVPAPPATQLPKQNPSRTTCVGVC